MTTARRRLRPLTADQLDDDQRIVYEAIALGPRSQGKQRQTLTDTDGAQVGPFNSMLLSGPVGMALQGLGSALRFGTELSDRERDRWPLRHVGVAPEGVQRRVAGGYGVK